MGTKVIRRKHIIQPAGFGAVTLIRRPVCTKWEKIMEEAHYTAAAFASAAASGDDDEVVVVVMIIMITNFCHFSADISSDLPAISLYLLMLIQSSTR